MTDVTSEQRYPAPGLGEHSDEILRLTGYSDTEIEQLRAEGIIA
jgi:crotonobetainyl-CoA:carnitine CoA-transferase CaiB-like acyl-CoA transferase